MPESKPTSSHQHKQPANFQDIVVYNKCALVHFKVYTEILIILTTPNYKERKTVVSMQHGKKMNVASQNALKGIKNLKILKQWNLVIQVKWFALKQTVLTRG